MDIKWLEVSNFLGLNRREEFGSFTAITGPNGEGKTNILKKAKVGIFQKVKIKDFKPHYLIAKPL